MQEIGRYELHHELASGGMATVYLGRLKGPVGFSRTVAIKRLHPHFAKQPEFTAMFIDEARIAARLAHPNVVATLDVVAESGELSLVMEYVAGESLHELVKLAGQVPPPIASAIGVGLLEGLHAAHEAKSERGVPLSVVHRDVSPQNVLVGVDGVARVLDFGIAKAVDRLQTTQDGGIKGKVAYMSPEQLRLEPVDRRTDIYAAGIVLWEMLTGRRMFRATNPVTALAELLATISEPPSQSNPGVSADLDRVVAMAIARDPANRFATAREFARALEHAAPPANARDVAAWVQGLADSEIGRRSELVSAMQAGTEVTAAVAVTPALEQPGTGVPVTRGSQPKRPRRFGYLVAAVAGAAVAALVVFATRSREPAALPQALPPPAVAVAAPPATEPQRANPPNPPAPASVSASRVTEASRAPKSAVRFTPVKKPSCTPAYTVDANGIKTYKPGCLK